MVKIKRSQAVVTVIMAFYALSLFMFSSPPTNNECDLYRVIQQMQKLNQTSASNSVNFQHALCEVIKTVRASAGLTAIIVEKSEKNTTNQSSILILSLKFPHILPASTVPPVLSLGGNNILSKEDQNYTSFDFPPEKPPPNCMNS
ncbi:hypothetical protein HGB07_00235 [Candidatus Roizmanbacteria bacterium]|nr:hypothetical protein [Candidatus Roizmanbacteria bacterium]